MGVFSKDSSEEVVGKLGLWQLFKRLIERELQDAEGSENIRFSYGHFGFVV